MSIKRNWWKEAVAYQVYPRALMTVIMMVSGLPGLIAVRLKI